MIDKPESKVATEARINETMTAGPEYNVMTDPLST
jgi:hypothetical protein